MKFLLIFGAAFLVTVVEVHCYVGASDCYTKCPPSTRRCSKHVKSSVDRLYVAVTIHCFDKAGYRIAGKKFTVASLTPGQSVQESSFYETYPVEIRMPPQSLRKPQYLRMFNHFDPRTTTTASIK